MGRRISPEIDVTLIVGLLIQIRSRLIKYNNPTLVEIPKDFVESVSLSENDFSDSFRE
jgi:hypothetical protein